MPLAIVLLISLYIVMVKWLYPNRMKSDTATKEIIHSQVAQLGKFSVAEKRTLVVFISTALLWITKDLLNDALPFRLDDNMIALIGATALFITPSGNEKQSLLSWDDTKKNGLGDIVAVWRWHRAGRGFRKSRPD